MPALRIGVVGAGHFGRFHALKVAASRRAALSGIADLDTARAAAVARETGTVALGLDALIEASDAVVIAAPAEAHFALPQARASRFMTPPAPCPCPKGLVFCTNKVARPRQRLL